jgi:hypothetical protein
MSGFLQPLGRRDVFGFLLPGTILVSISAYILWGVIASLQLPVGSLLSGNEFFLTVVFLAFAYLLGGMLRLFSADDVDKKSRKYLLNEWNKERRTEITHAGPPGFEKKRLELARGGDVADIPDGFDDWLWRADYFPYSAWMNRFWRIYDFRDVLNFYLENYKLRMWPDNPVSNKSFFNYCKLVVSGSNEALANEIDTAEGQTRFFAGTVTALLLSTRLLIAALVIQALLLTIGVALAFSVDWRFQGFYFGLTLSLMFVSRWMVRQVVERFKRMRQKETETVYHAFYFLQSMNTSLAEGQNGRKSRQGKRVITPHSPD